MTEFERGEQELARGESRRKRIWFVTKIVVAAVVICAQIPTSFWESVRENMKFVNKVTVYPGEFAVATCGRYAPRSVTRGNFYYVGSHCDVQKFSSGIQMMEFTTNMMTNDGSQFQVHAAVIYRLDANEPTLLTMLAPGDIQNGIAGNVKLGLWKWAVQRSTQKFLLDLGEKNALAAIEEGATQGLPAEVQVLYFKRIDLPDHLKALLEERAEAEVQLERALLAQKEAQIQYEAAIAKAKAAELAPR